MADLTPLLTSLLEKHNARCHRNPHQPKDEFLKEAYRINTHISSLTAYLHSIRAPYLSTASPLPRSSLKRTPNTPSTYLTDPQREAIDASSSTLLRDIRASITQLSQAETVRQQTLEQVAAKKRSRVAGALMRWAEGGGDTAGKKGRAETEVGGEELTLRGWRDGVLFYLQLRLREAGEVQRGMSERRLEREVERSRSVLYKTRGVPSGLVEEDEKAGMNGFIGEKNAAGWEGARQGGGGVYKGKGKLGAVEMEEERRADTGLSQEQLQLFREENNDMLRHYEDTLDKVRNVERSVIEISDMQNQISANLSEQQESIDQLVTDSFNTTENVGGGNTQLKRATERKSTARMVFWATCGLCSFLVVWDLVF